MKSMTGYGRGECSQRGFKVTIEVSSVNRKQTEIAVNLPRDLEVLEAQIRDEINRRVARGRLTVRVSVHAAEAAAGKMRINTALAKAYARELRALAKSLHLADDVTLDMLARAPGVLQPAEEIREAEELWPATAKALNAALDMLLKMREREGACLAKDLKARVARLRAGVRRVQDLAPQVGRALPRPIAGPHQVRRAGSAGLGGRAPGQGDFLLCRPPDISEELTRLQSHFQQFDDCVKSNGAGRAHAGFSGAGNQPRDQHPRLQGQRQRHFPRGRVVEGRIGKIPRASPERRMKPPDAIRLARRC